MDHKNQKETGKHEHPLSNQISAKEKEATDLAHKQADEDIENDLEISAHSPNDDLDEGETARLGSNESLV
jgi:hypothetical protein